MLWMQIKDLIEKCIRKEEVIWDVAKYKILS